ncbi:GNAT superfamily N-acetyltransferase [Evansella vedderi]|uniref:GNAT superfamily N-acetyltransferase n=1 Tax=Evansella vedderi TaxID=38282 RepID=A0ABT9ZZS1_9BACI|nr:GNAT family N-acetyltransferase [Evansella vedderi]MDQ0256743.1 GNAT superfamily N-acetyltransferase [Evansella vedderi]
MKIRDASKEEREEIRRQRVDAYKEHADKIPEAHWEALKQVITSEADNLPGVELIVAEEEGDLLGSVALFPAKTDAYEGHVEELDYPEIRLLAVVPFAQGKGVASHLITECIRRTKEKGYDSIGLHTGEFMKGALKLYERFGFERQPQYDFEPADDGIIVKAYRLKLTD